MQRRCEAISRRRGELCRRRGTVYMGHGSWLCGVHVTYADRFTAADQISPQILLRQAAVLAWGDDGLVTRLDPRRTGEALKREQEEQSDGD